MQTTGRSMADTGPIEGRYMPHSPPIVGRYGKRPHSRMRRLQLRTAHASKRQGHGRAPAQWSRRSCQRCVWCAEPSGAARIRAAERAYFANYRQRWPDYPSVGRAEWNHRMVNNMKRRKQKANTSKPASSPPLDAPAQALSGDETKRRMALVNADREIVRKIMTEPGPRWEPQSPPRAENAANFFSVGGQCTFRARRGRRPAVKQARRR